MDRQTVSAAVELLEQEQPPAHRATSAILKRVLSRLPEPDHFALLRTPDGGPALAFLTSAGLRLVNIEKAHDDVAAVGGQHVALSLIPLPPTDHRTSLAEFYEGEATTTIVRRWSFDLRGPRRLEFETRQLANEPVDRAEEFAEALLARLGW